jgi:hypothetical protein
MNCFINAHYRKGDTVLLEGVPTGACCCGFPEIMGLKNDILAWGWDVDNIEEVEFPCNREAKNMYSKIEGVWTKILTYFDFEELGRNLDCISQEIQELIDYFDSSLEPAKVTLKKYYEDSKKASLPLDFFKILTSEMLQKFRENDVAPYRHMRQEDYEIIRKTKQDREYCLVRQIKLRRSRNERLFVIAGASHVLGWSDKLKVPFPREVQACLSSEKFVLIANKRPLTKEVIEFNKQFFSLLKQIEL